MKVVIVDDEHFACAALEKLVKDYFKQYSMPLVCTSFEDSRLALEYLNTNKADLLMTDIKMAGVDGLELAAFVQKADMDTVVISGYADFAYAQSALKCEVSDYLLKPISRKQIYACLEERVRRHRMRCEEKKEMEESKKHSCYHQITANPNFQTRMLFDDLNKEKEYLSELMVMVFSEEPLLPSDKGELEACKKIKETDTVEIENPNGTIVLLIYFINEINQELIRDRVLKQCNLCYKNIVRKNSKRKILISVSQSGNPNSLNQLFRECSEALNKRILNPEQYLFDYEKFTDKRGSHASSDSSLEHELKQSFEFKDATLSKSIVDRQIQKMIEKEDVSLWNLTDFISRTSAIINKVIYEYNRDSQNQLAYIPEASLTQFGTIEEIKGYFHFHINGVYKVINKDDAEENVVNKLIRYIEENYFLNISLAEISKKIFYLNSSYLSRLFKAQTGINFSKYLMDYRMEKAREYLCSNQEISVQEVASFTGFSDGSYFVKQFKKQYGETPGDYQRGKAIDSGNQK